MRKRGPKTTTPIQEWTHSRVGDAIASGTLVRQPCEVCGSTRNVQAHHDDYLQPLDVRWLCVPHHRAWHREHGPGANHDAPVPPSVVGIDPSHPTDLRAMVKRYIESPEAWWKRAKQ